MTSNAYSLRRQTLQSLTAIKRPDVPLRVVLRNTAAVIVPLGIGIATGHTEVGLGVGAGALNTMFSDQPGPYRQRLRQLLLASTVAGVASLTGFLLGSMLPALLMATALFGFFGGMLVVFGTDTARLGMTSLILLVVTASTPTSLPGALGGAALITAGGLLLTLLSLAAWPWQRYLPERSALAGVYDGLAAMMAQAPGTDSDAPALSDAMTSLQRTLLGRFRAHGRAMEAFGVLLELAERMRLELTAIEGLYPASAAASAFRARAAGVLGAIADALRQGESPVLAQRAMELLKSDERAWSVQCGPGLSAHLHAFSGQLAAAVRNSDWAGSRGEVRASAAEASLPPPLRSAQGWPMLRANLTPQSTAFRHALRTAVCLCIALLASRYFHLGHGYWLPMTIAIVLRPDFAATFNMGLLRVLGTLGGLALTTALLYVTPDQPFAHLALMAVLCMSFRYLATAHYGIAVAALTGTVVILLSFEGVSPAAAVTARVINTSLGCALALAAYLVWPTWERGQSRAAMAAMLNAYAVYLNALTGADVRTRRDARNAARIVRTNAQASLERMQSEPGTPATLLNLTSKVFANGNRLARTAMALEALLDVPHPPAVAESLTTFVATMAARVQELAEALGGQRDPVPGPDLRARQHALLELLGRQQGSDGNGIERISDRLVDNVDTLAHVLARHDSGARG